MDGREAPVNPALTEFLEIEGATIELAEQIAGEVNRVSGGEARIWHTFAAEQEEGCEGSINEKNMIRAIAGDYRIEAMRILKANLKLDDGKDADLIGAMKKYAGTVAQTLIVSVVKNPDSRDATAHFGIPRPIGKPIYEVNVCHPSGMGFPDSDV